MYESGRMESFGIEAGLSRILQVYMSTITKMRTSSIKGTAMAWLISLYLAWPNASSAKEGASNASRKVSVAKENISACLSGESLARAANHGLAGLVKATQLSEQCKPSATKKDFWELLIRISKRSLPELTIPLERAWWDQESYHQVMNFFFDSGYFLNPDSKTITKIDEKIDVPAIVPELSCLFWGNEPLQFARLSRIQKGWNLRQRWVVLGSVWAVATASLKEVYNRIYSDSSHSYEEIARWVVAHEATHSILAAYFGFFNTTHLYRDLPDVTQSDIHEYLGYAGWYCVNDHSTEAMLIGMLREIKFDWNVLSTGKVTNANYRYSHSALLWLISRTSRFSEISKIFVEQYNANNINGRPIDIFEDTGRLTRTKAIMWLLTMEDREMIRKAFIKKGKELLWEIWEK